MAATSSGEDPMDLGPFLQNYVMKNPFRTQQSTTVDGRQQSDRADGRWPSRWRGSWPRLSAALRARRRGDKASMVNGGGDHDTVSIQSTNRVLHDAEMSCEGDVTAWLRDNYRCPPVPGRHRLFTQHLLLNVQQVFPHVTADTIDNFVMAAFPGCMKMNNRKNGLAFYQGLVARPDPEVYENPLFTAALDSITSGLLTTGQAAEKFGIRESALIAALSWSDVEQCSVAVPATVSTSSLQCDAVVSSAGQKRVYFADAEQDSAGEPQCRRYKCSIDDAVDFEMMLQDISSSGENTKLDRRSISPQVSDNGQTPSQDEVSVKPEPECNLIEEQSATADSQPLNFSLSANSPQNAGAAAVDGTQSRADADSDKISPPSTASSATSPVNCTDSDSCRRLHSELAAAVAANLALQEELSARDFHLAQLAEDFFCLHEQFKQLARQFQAVLGDIQPVSNQTGVSRIARNHTR